MMATLYSTLTLKTLSQDPHQRANQLANLATQALLDEARLTPKPGLVDQRSAGCHSDMSLALMERSALSLRETFYRLAFVSYLQTPSLTLRESIGQIGREGERQMLYTTNGVNTHRGAIWALGLLVCACAMQKGKKAHYLHTLTSCAAKLAKLDDRNIPAYISKGQIVRERYGVANAKEEAQRAFPHITELAYPQLLHSRNTGATENQARINALLAIMTSLTDTCILSRGSLSHLEKIHLFAKNILTQGGYHHPQGVMIFSQLEQFMKDENLSPGGAADLLAATLFLDNIINPVTQ